MTGTVTVGNNSGVATLSGTGFISGLVTTATTGSNVAHIAPGPTTATSNFGGVGTLTLSGGLTIGAGSNLDFDLNTTTAVGDTTNDLISLGNGTTGALTLSNFTINYSLLNATLATTGSYTLISGFQLPTSGRAEGLNWGKEMSVQCIALLLESLGCETKVQRVKMPEARPSLAMGARQIKDGWSGS